MNPLNQYPKWALAALGAILLIVFAFFLGSKQGLNSRDGDITILEKQIKSLTGENETLYVKKKSLEDSNKVLSVAVKTAEDARFRMQAIVDVSRQLVTIADPSHLEVKGSMDQPATLVEVPTVVVARLKNEQLFSDSLLVEIAVKDEQHAVDSLRISNLESIARVDTLTNSKLRQEVSFLREAQQCKILWLIPCPSRTATAVLSSAITAATAVVLVVSSKRS